MPRLTEVGAWRPQRQGKYGNVPAIRDTTEPRTYGGFYTHEDIRELVQYAADRFVNILPEIDVPGHNMAAIASYPELSCTPGSYYVNAGEKFMQWHGNGKFSALVDNNLCPSKEFVYEFLDSVFTEVAMLFPFQYIHMGGDEAAKNLWEKSDTITSLMKRENLKDLDEVQSYFVKRVEQIIRSKGKKMIGWDEILEGGLAPEATVMSWRGMKGGIEAAKQNHAVVMSPSDFVYMDLMQGDKITEPYVYSSVRLSKTYKFDPVPEGVNPALILGGQGNLWTEHITNIRAAQYMLWPRGLALAESVWTPKEKKNYDRFISKVENEFERMDVRKVKYAKTMYEPIVTATLDKDQVKVKLETEIPGLDIFYSFDETNPDEFYPKYKTVLAVPKDAFTLKIITYKDGKPVGRQINLPVSELEKRAGKK
jgi:hexosaminidase